MEEPAGADDKKEPPAADEATADSQDCTRDMNQDEHRDVSPAGPTEPKPSEAEGAAGPEGPVQPDAQIITNAPVRGRVTQVQPPICQVPGCGKDLSGCRGYHQRYKICEEHIRVHSMVRNGQVVRFCQQCGKFQPIEDFHQDRRSCSIQLALHAGRRRKRHALAKAQRTGGGLPNSSSNRSSDNEVSATHDGTKKRSKSDDAQTSGLNTLTDEEMRMLRVIIRKAGTDIVKGLAHGMGDEPPKDSKSTTASPNVDGLGAAHMSGLTRDELPQGVNMAAALQQPGLMPLMAQGCVQLVGMQLPPGPSQQSVAPQGGLAGGQLTQLPTLDMSSALQWAGGLQSMTPFTQLPAAQTLNSQQAPQQQQQLMSSNQPYMLMVGSGMGMSGQNGSGGAAGPSTSNTAALAAGQQLMSNVFAPSVLQLQAGGQVMTLQQGASQLGQAVTALPTLDAQQPVQQQGGGQQRAGGSQVVQVSGAAGSSLAQPTYMNSNMVQLLPWGLQYATYEPTAAQPAAAVASGVLQPKLESGQAEMTQAGAGPSTGTGTDTYSVTVQAPHQQQVVQLQEAQQQQQQVVMAGSSTGVQMPVTMSLAGMSAAGGSAGFQAGLQPQQLVILPQGQYLTPSPAPAQASTSQHVAWPGSMMLSSLPQGMTVLSQADLAALLQQNHTLGQLAPGQQPPP